MLFQVVAQNLGRRPSILIAGFGFITCLIIIQFANSIYYIWVLAAFIQGFGAMGDLGSFLIMNEVLSVSRRSASGAIVQSAFSFSGTLFIGLYYYMDSWRLPFLVAAMITFLNIFLFFVIGFESPRYFLNKNKLNDFFLTLGKIAKFNGNGSKFNELILYNYGLPIIEDDTPTPYDKSRSQSASEKSDEILITKKEDEADKTQEFKKIIEEIKEFSEQKSKNKENNLTKKINCLSLLTYKSQRLNFITMCYMWFCTSGVYYGLTINIKNLPGNTYITGIVMFFVEAIAYILSGNLIGISFLGRKKTILLFYMISFIVYCIILIFSIDSYWLTVLSLTARFAVSGVYNIIYTYSAEVYPTSVRSNGLAYNSVSGRIGGMVFPLLLEVLHDSIVYVFMALNIGALAAVMILPETLGKVLSDSVPEYIKDNENIKNKEDPQN